MWSAGHQRHVNHVTQYFWLIESLFWSLLMILAGWWNCVAEKTRSSVLAISHYFHKHHMVIVTKWINTLCWIIKDWRCDCALCTNKDLMSWIISSRLARCTLGEQSQSMTLPWLLCLRLRFSSIHQRSMAHRPITTLRGRWPNYGWESTHYDKWAMGELSLFLLPWQHSHMTSAQVFQH